MDGHITSSYTCLQSVFAWGMAGAVALKADKLRWIPGQKKARYDIAGFITMIQVRTPALAGIIHLLCVFSRLEETK